MVDPYALLADAKAALNDARTLHPTPVELEKQRAESTRLCPTCIEPAPCATRQALDNGHHPADGQSVDEHELLHTDLLAAAVPAETVDAAQRYDREHRPPSGWTAAPDGQVRRLLAGAQLDAAREVARLRAGEAAEPAPDGTWSTPSQWIRRWNEVPPGVRLAMADQILRNAQAAHDCAMAHGLRARLGRKDTGRG